MFVKMLFKVYMTFLVLDRLCTNFKPKNFHLGLSIDIHIMHIIWVKNGSLDNCVP